MSIFSNIKLFMEDARLCLKTVAFELVPGIIPATIECVVIRYGNSRALEEKIRESTANIILSLDDFLKGTNETTSSIHNQCSIAQQFLDILTVANERSNREGFPLSPFWGCVSEIINNDPQFFRVYGGTVESKYLFADEKRQILFLKSVHKIANELQACWEQRNR